MLITVLVNSDMPLVLDNAHPLDTLTTLSVLGRIEDTAVSPLIAEQLEKRLEKEGMLNLTEGELAGLFDFRARRLVGTSGENALKRIRNGRAGSNLAWTELQLLAALIR